MGVYRRLLPMKGASIPMASKVYFTNFRCEGNENLLQKFRRL